MKDKKGQFKALAKQLTEIDEGGIAALKKHNLFKPTKYALRIGITGPPGAGKSTLISGLIKEFSNQGLSVGVLAVDPSSPFSQGALLGDRIRYQDAINKGDIFVRSIGSRGSPGGLSSSSYLMLRAYDQFGFDVVIVETVGVGQTELEIMNVADITVVVLVPESGDGIQMMKAGLMEIADLFVINKFDRPGAQSLMDELKNELSFLSKNEKIKIFATTANLNTGISELASELSKKINLEQIKKNRMSEKKIKAEAKALLRNQSEKIITKIVEKIKKPEDLIKLSSADLKLRK